MWDDDSLQQSEVRDRTVIMRMALRMIYVLRRRRDAGFPRVAEVSEQNGRCNSSWIVRAKTARGGINCCFLSEGCWPISGDLFLEIALVSSLLSKSIKFLSGSWIITIFTSNMMGIAVVDARRFISMSFSCPQNVFQFLPLQNVQRSGPLLSMI